MNRELPILFNTKMVRAILDGRKTVTRRVINRDITNRCDVDTDGTLLCFEDEYGDHISPEKLSRYQVGDILYVRETWAKDSFGHYVYKTDYEGTLLSPDWKWKPSIHMPKEAARIWLKVTDVRVERLQDITEEQAYMEGTDPWDEACYANNGWHPTLADPDSGGNPNIIDGFHELWNSTIKKSERDLYGFDANPWVFVYEFERIEHEQ